MHLVRSHVQSEKLFDGRFDQIPTDSVRRYQWLCELSDRDHFLFHGSSNGNIDELAITRQSDDINEFGRREQVFATPDIFWAMWFALLDRSRIQINSNECFIDSEELISYYRFAIDIASYRRDPAPLKDGWIYVLSPDFFVSKNEEISYKGLLLAEYGSSVPVTPVARFKVSVDDFPFVDSIQPYVES